MAKERAFVVEGEGSFPDDMLRYDQCRVQGEADGSFDKRRVTLVTTDRSGLVPTVGRWASFGWTVIEPPKRRRAR